MLYLYFVRCFTLTYVADILNDCVCCDIGSRIGDDGIRDIAEALTVNSTLVAIGLAGRNIFFLCVFHSPFTYSRAGTTISKVAASYIVDAFKANATLTSVWLAGERESLAIKKLCHIVLILPR